jgi:hypothetical protein
VNERPGSLALWCLSVAAAGAVVAGCYNPNVQDGGFLCGADKRCPDGYSCAADNRCRKSADGGVCSSPPVTMLCSDEPASGQICNPTCQTGCACGRCNVVGDSSACTPAGTKALGQVCNIGADDCSAGYICLAEACGNSLGRCYRHCTTSDQCMGTICQIPIDDAAGNHTGFKACDVPIQTCDPVQNTGCPDPALNCYMTSTNQTLCDCPSSGTPRMQGESCNVYNDCAAGLICVSVGTGGPQCRRLCRVAAGALCAASTSACVSLNGTYGYCS